MLHPHLAVDGVGVEDPRCVCGAVVGVWPVDRSGALRCRRRVSDSRIGNLDAVARHGRLDVEEWMGMRCC
eukprot:7382932-Prymnesium_polylepis.2